MIRYFIFLRSLLFILAAFFLLGATTSCATPSENSVEASPLVTKIIFPDGITLSVDLPMPTKELMDKVEEKGGGYRIYGVIPSSEVVDADRAYQIYAGYDYEDRVNRIYFAYEKDDMIVYLEESFSWAKPAWMLSPLWHYL